MKKLTLLVIVAILATSLLAAGPAKLYPLTVINDSGYPVYIKLEGMINGQFYYLTIPDGETMRFTLLGDVYKRTTWACDGIKTSGQLAMVSQVRLRFTQCFAKNLKWSYDDLNLNGFWDFGEPIWQAKNQGEPTQEKVVYFKYITGGWIWWYNCGFWLVATVTYKTPVGCQFRYQY